MTVFISILVIKLIRFKSIVTYLKRHVRFSGRGEDLGLPLVPSITQFKGKH